MRRLLVILGISLSMCGLSRAQTFDPQDPFRTVSFDLLNTMVEVAVSVSDAWVKIQARDGSANELAPQLTELRRLDVSLKQELLACGDADRQAVHDTADRLLRMSFSRPDRMVQLSFLAQMLQAAYRTDLDTIQELGDLIDADYLRLSDFDGDGRLTNQDVLPSTLLDNIGQLLSRRGFFRSLLAIGQILEAKNALTRRWEERFYPRAMFFLGDIDGLRAFAADHEIDLIDDWIITAALRAGAEEEAIATQKRLDNDEPDNLSRILFFETQGARVAHCGNMMQARRDHDTTIQQEQEAGIQPTWFGSWEMLLCGQYADARRAALKATWAHRQAACSANRTNVDLTNQYNAILAGVYQAAELRELGAREQSTELLDTVVEEVRQALFLDRFTGYSSLEIVIEDDIAIYMSRLHGPRAELSLVKGMLERGRGNLSTAIADFEEALRLSGVGPSEVIEVGMEQSDGLDIKWLLQLVAWIDEIEASQSQGG